MKFSGFIKTSLIDYPDTLASVVYLPKCNFSCSFCHNSDLLDDHLPDIEQETIFNHLEKRKNIIDGIVITGGEPTLHDGLISFLEKVKTKGVKIKLDTNGYRPVVLKKILEHNLVDYVAMDIKNTQEKYMKTVSRENMEFDNILESIKLIKNAGIDYEFRTTLMKEYHSKLDVDELGKLVDGSKKFVFQQYEYSEKQIKDMKYTFFSVEEMLEMKDKLNDSYKVDKIEVRGRF